MEKIRVLMPTQVPMLHEHVNYATITESLNLFVKQLSGALNLDDLEDWRILVKILSRQADLVGIYKRTTRYPSEKEFEVSITIPIPDVKTVSYGYAERNEKRFAQLESDKFYTLEPNYEKYSNLYDFILDSSKLAIELGFKKGLTMNGKKIKITS